MGLIIFKNNLEFKKIDLIIKKKKIIHQNRYIMSHDINVSSNTQIYFLNLSKLDIINYLNSLINLKNFKNNFELKKIYLINCILNQNIVKYYVGNLVLKYVYKIKNLTHLYVKNYYYLVLTKKMLITFCI